MIARYGAEDIRNRTIGFEAECIVCEAVGDLTLAGGVFVCRIPCARGAMSLPYLTMNRRTPA